MKTALTLAAIAIPLLFGAEETKRLAPDGVNTITENADGSQSMTLLHVPINGTRLANHTYEELVRMGGKRPIGKTEAEEIVKALEMSASAHYTALTFFDQALKSFGRTASEQDRKQMESNLKQCAENSLKTMALLELWKKRAAELTD